MRQRVLVCRTRTQRSRGKRVRPPCPSRTRSFPGAQARVARVSFLVIFCVQSTACLASPRIAAEHGHGAASRAEEPARPRWDLVDADANLLHEALAGQLETHLKVRGSTSDRNNRLPLVATVFCLYQRLSLLPCADRMPQDRATARSPAHGRARSQPRPVSGMSATVLEVSRGVLCDCRRAPILCPGFVMRHAARSRPHADSTLCITCSSG